MRLILNKKFVKNAEYNHYEWKRCGTKYNGFGASKPKYKFTHICNYVDLNSYGYIYHNEIIYIRYKANEMNDKGANIYLICG